MVGLVVWVLVKGRVGTGVTVNGFRCGGAVSVVVPGWLCGMEVAVFDRCGKVLVVRVLELTVFAVVCRVEFRKGTK